MSGVLSAVGLGDLLGLSGLSGLRTMVNEVSESEQEPLSLMMKSRKSPKTFWLVSEGVSVVWWWKISKETNEVELCAQLT